MWSGLGKPGALPLLALIVFSLLTLVPSLSNIYNLKLADFNLYPGGARQVSLLQDGMTEIPTAHPLSEHKPWALSAPHRSRVNLLPRTARVNNPAISASETTAVANKSRLPSSSRESSFSFTHRARAFRTYFIQQLDDYPFLTSFSNRTPPDHPYPTTTLNQSLPATLPTYNHIHIFDPIREMYQQACDIAIDLGTRGTEYVKSIFPSETEQHLIRKQTQIDPQTQTQTQTPSPEQVQANQKVGAEDSTDAAAGRHSPELHGSCMAVVIGLVAGIMWF